MDFKDIINEEAKQYGAENRSSDRFEFDKEGVYKMRILAMPRVMATHFIGGKGGTAAICIGMDNGCPFHGENAPKDDKGKEKKPSLKLVTYIIDRNTQKVRLAELPLSISYSLNDLKNNEDFTFENFPMPYDVKITYEPNNPDPKAKYRMMPVPKHEDLTGEQEAEFASAMAKMTPDDYVQKRKEKQMTKIETVPSKPSYPTAEDEGIDLKDIPFD